MSENTGSSVEEDTDDQKRLREVVLTEIEAVMAKHNVGGAAFVVSEESAAWRFTVPAWAGMRGLGPHVRFTWKKTEQSKADVTMHFLGAVRDMSGRCALMFAEMWDLLLKHGVVVEHKVFQGFGVGKNQG